jgi:hypothetical protein
VGAGVRLPGQTGQTTDFFLIFFLEKREKKNMATDMKKFLIFFGGKRLGWDKRLGQTEPRNHGFGKNN